MFIIDNDSYYSSMTKFTSKCDFNQYKIWDEFLKYICIYAMTAKNNYKSITYQRFVP